MADVFLSYARPDEARVRRIADLLASEGHEVWWDADLPPHRAYSEVIQEEVGRAKAVLVAWSREALGSEWVRAEADMARNDRKLVQVSLDDTNPPLPFNQIHVVKLANWHGSRDDAEWQRVLRSIAEILGRPVEPAEPKTIARALARQLRAFLADRRRMTWIALLIFVPLLAVGAGYAGWRYASEQTSAAVKTALARQAAITGATRKGPELKPLDPDSKIGFILADSDTRVVDASELKKLTFEELALARNEIYARHGIYFKKAHYRQYFSTMPWYLPKTLEIPEDALTQAERDNLVKIRAAEKSYLDTGQIVRPEEILKRIPKVPSPQ
ncbi:MAG: TIR domain-containing protein [Alphaproteobacteria bacterium]